MKKTIAKWLRNAADKLTGGHTIHLGTGREFKFKLKPSKFNELEQQKEAMAYNDATLNEEREWVRESIIMGIRKAIYDDGILSWDEKITEDGGVITANICIISPVKIEPEKIKDDLSIYAGNKRVYRKNATT